MEQYQAYIAADQCYQWFMEHQEAVSLADTVTLVPVTQVQLKIVPEEGHSFQVKRELEEPVVPTRLPLADKFQNWVAFQKMQMQDLHRQGHLQIDNQGIAFEGLQPINKMRCEFAE